MNDEKEEQLLTKKAVAEKVSPLEKKHTRPKQKQPIKKITTSSIPWLNKEIIANKASNY